MKLLTSISFLYVFYLEFEFVRADNDYQIGDPECVLQTAGMCENLAENLGLAYEYIYDRNEVYNGYHGCYQVGVQDDPSNVELRWSPGGDEISNGKPFSQGNYARAYCGLPEPPTFAYEGNPNCVIRDEESCRQEATTRGTVFSKNPGEPGNAGRHGCYLGDRSGKPYDDDGKATRIVWNDYHKGDFNGPLPGSFVRIYCGLPEGETVSPTESPTTRIWYVGELNNVIRDKETCEKEAMAGNLDFAFNPGEPGNAARHGCYLGDRSGKPTRIVWNDYHRGDVTGEVPYPMKRVFLGAYTKPVPTFQYTFPTVDSTSFVHGLCVMDASEVVVSADNDNYLWYVPDDNNGIGFGNGMKLWGGRDFTASGVQEPGMCSGGTYLRPSRHDTVEEGTSITVDIVAKDMFTSSLTLCAFVESGGLERTGEWDSDLVGQGFAVSKEFHWGNGSIDGSARFYCKKLFLDVPAPAPTPRAASRTQATGEPTGSPTSLATSDPEELILCPNDIELLSTNGVTEFPSNLEDHITISSKEVSTVTIDLWDTFPAEKYFYQYMKNEFSSKCYESDDLEGRGEKLETIAIQCNVLRAVAHLEICVQDSTGSMLSAVDQATVSECCHSSAPPGTPTVCYFIEINCTTKCSDTETEFAARRHRNLRGHFIE